VHNAKNGPRSGTGGAHQAQYPQKPKGESRQSLPSPAFFMRRVHPQQTAALL
jgi:hypothetical protein